MTIPTGAALEPCSCPFCGADAACTFKSQIDFQDVWAVFCHVCESEGPHSGKTEAEAIAAWNRRAPSPAALGEGEAELFDANVNRLKACEHIADGDEGWEKLRNECPSTAAVARLRDALTDMREERERLREALRTVQLAKLNGLFDPAIDKQIAGDVNNVFAEVDAALSQAQDE